MPAFSLKHTGIKRAAAEDGGLNTSWWLAMLRNLGTAWPLIGMDGRANSTYVHYAAVGCHRLLHLDFTLVTFRVSRRRRDMYSGHGRLCVGPIANLKGHYFQPSLSVCLCVSLTGTSALQR